MKRVAAIVLVLCLVACSKKSGGSGPTSVPGEKVYPIRGKIVSKISGNSIDLDHEAIPGFMEAMEMPYEVRGAAVKDLPPQGSRIDAKLHVIDDGYWLTDVKKAP